MAARLTAYVVVAIVAATFIAGLMVGAQPDNSDVPVDLIVQIQRLRDGTRRITHVTEVLGMEGETVVLQDAFAFDFSAGLDEHGRFRGSASATGLRPRFLDKFDNLGIPYSMDMFDPERR